MPAIVKQEDFLVEPPPESDEDEVVQEIPVFLSPAMAQQLYLLQYPLHQTTLDPPTEARIKPLHGMIEVDLPLPNDIEHDGDFHLVDRTFASHTIPVETHMCLGRAQTNQDGEISLHWVPISHISQMRPSFDHVDQAAQLDRPLGEMDDDAAADDSMERKPLVFHRKESERAAMARKSSYAFKKTSQDDEPWQNLIVHRDHSIEYRNRMQAAFCPDLTVQLLERTETNAGYADSLNYMTTASGAGKEKVTEINEADLPTVIAKLTTLLHRGWPIPYSILRGQFSSAVDDEVLLHSLSICAVLIRGNFGAHSNFLALSEDLKKARTFLLLLLHQNGIIERKRLTHVFPEGGKVASGDVLALLKQVGKQTQGGWTCRTEDDDDFLEMHPDVVSLHSEYWTRQESRFGRELKLYHEFYET